MAIVHILYECAILNINHLECATRVQIYENDYYLQDDKVAITTLGFHKSKATWNSKGKST